MATPFDPYHRWLGIAPDEQPPHHYRLLGVRLFESDAEVIENAADQRMAHLRTFSTGKHAAQAQRLLNEVSAARGCLLVPTKKASYDQQLRETGVGAAAKPAHVPVGVPVNVASPTSPAPARSAKPGVQVPQSVPMGKPAATTAPAGRRATKSSFPILLAVSGGVLVLVLVAGGVAAVLFSGSGGAGDDGTIASDGGDAEPAGDDAENILPQPPPDEQRISQAVHPLTVSLRGAAEPRGASEATDFAFASPSGMGGPGNWQALADRSGISVDVAADIAPVLPLPVKAGDDYRLELTVKAPPRHAGLALDLAIGGRPCRLVIDQPNEGGCYTGFAPVDAETMRHSRYLLYHLSTDKPNEISCTVDGNHVLLMCNDSAIFEWQGGPDTLPSPTDPAVGFQVERKASSPPLESSFVLSKARVFRMKPDPVPLPPSPGGTVDLIAAIDPARDFAVGNASIGDGKLTTIGRFPTIVKLPCNVPDEYLLDIRLTRTNVTDPTVIVGVVVGDGMGWVVVDSASTDKRPASGLALIDGRRPNHETNRTTVLGRQLLPTDKASELQILVQGRRDDGKCRVAASIEGVKFLDFVDDRSRLTSYQGFDQHLGGQQCLSVGCWNCTLEFERIVLRPVSEAPAALRTEGPIASVPDTAEKPALAAVPDAAALAEAAKQVADAFGRERNEAQSREAKQALARQLIETAAAESDPVKIYALLDAAQSLAVAAEDPALTLEIVDARAKRFDVDVWDQKAEALARLMETKSNLRREMAVGASLDVLEGAIEAKAYSGADKLTEALQAAATAGKLYTLRKHVAAQRDRIDAGKQAEAAAKAARATLESNPDGPAAAAVLGRWLCMTENNWEEGLPLLAKSDDPTFATVARQEAALADDAAGQQQVDVADAWWKIAENQADASIKAALWAHAAELFRRALPKVESVLTQRAVEGRLAQFEKSAAAPAASEGFVVLPWLLRDALLLYNFERGTVAPGVDKKIHVADLSGNALHGTMEGGQKVRVAKGQIGFAGYFDGQHDFILCPGLRARMLGLKQLTVAAWINSNKPEGDAFLFNVGYHAERAVGLHMLEGKPAFSASSHHGGVTVKGETLEQGGWHHVAGVWDGNEQRLYVDGKLVARQPTRFTVFDDTTIGGEEVHLGTQAKPFFREGRYFAGLMDEMVVLPRAFSDVEVNQLFRAGEATTVLPALFEK